MKITQLSTENFKRIKAVTVTPDGAIVQITGRNGQGKSSLLDAIEAAIGGVAHAPVEPVRAGEDKARIVCTLGEGDDALVVRRTFTAAGGGSLVVENAKGARYGSPQAVLDKLVGTLTFDPLAFVRLPPKAQLDTLRRLVGLDFAEEEKRRADLFAERTGVNRTATAMRAQTAGWSPITPDPPAEEVSVAALAEELQRADAANVKVDAVHRQLADRARAVESSAMAIGRREQELADLRQEQTYRMAEAEAFRQKVLKLPPKADTQPLRERIAGAEGANARYREASRRRQVQDQLSAAEAEAMRLTNAMTAIDAAQRERTQAAKFPVEGLALTDAGVKLAGVPFGQASSAEQVRASAAIGLAMNPALRVLLIRDGSLLDGEGMARLAEFAEANDAQVWVERVSDGEAVGIVIEDGMVNGGPNPYDEADAAARAEA